MIVYLLYQDWHVWGFFLEGGGIRLLINMYQRYDWFSSTYKSIINWLNLFFFALYLSNFVKALEDQRRQQRDRPPVPCWSTSRTSPRTGRKRRRLRSRRRRMKSLWSVIHTESFIINLAFSKVPGSLVIKKMNGTLIIWYENDEVFICFNERVSFPLFP